MVLVFSYAVAAAVVVLVGGDWRNPDQHDREGPASETTMPDSLKCDATMLVE